MGVPFGTLLSFLLPVFGIGILNVKLTVEEKKQKLFYFLIGEAVFCSIVSFFTIIFWIKGHSRLSIITLMAQQQVKDEMEKDKNLKATLLTANLMASKLRSRIESQNNPKGNGGSHNDFGIKTKDFGELERRNGASHNDYNGKGFSTRTGGMEKRKKNFGEYHSQANQNFGDEKVSSISHEDGDGGDSDGQSMGSEIRRKLFEEQLKKGKSIFFHVRHLFKRGTLLLLIINYGLSFGSLTAQGSLAADIYSLYGVNQVRKKYFKILKLWSAANNSVSIFGGIIGTTMYNKFLSKRKNQLQYLYFILLLS